MREHHTTTLIIPPTFEPRDELVGVLTPTDIALRFGHELSNASTVRIRHRADFKTLDAELWLLADLGGFTEPQIVGYNLHSVGPHGYMEMRITEQRPEKIVRYVVEQRPQDAQVGIRFNATIEPHGSRLLDIFSGILDDYRRRFEKG